MRGSEYEIFEKSLFWFIINESFNCIKQKV